MDIAKNIIHIWRIKTFLLFVCFYIFCIVSEVIPINMPEVAVKSEIKVTNSDYSVHIRRFSFFVFLFKI
jgi:hypothetical protein